MSLKKNIFANYVSQLYVTLAGIVMVPLYISYMGAEAYGLVGFFAMLQAWFNLLDLGLSPTIARESARFKGGVLPALDYRRVFRALSLLFLTIAMAGGGGLWLLADSVANSWLSVETLPHAEVILALKVMAVSVALRWMSGLYRGVVSGFEQQVWLGGFTAVIATLRFVAVLGSMWLWGYTPTVFFLHQLVVSVLEVGGGLLMCHQLLPKKEELDEPIGWSFRPIQPLLKFALTVAFTSSVWVLVTQADKLVLSGILPLAEYGYFTLAVLVASGILVITGPISAAIMPRMARLHAEGEHEEIIRLYRQSTQWVSVLAGSAAITLVFCAKPLLFLWSGNLELAENAAPILQLYAAGNGLLAVAAFPYYLQYARGNLRYHLLGNAVMVTILVPSIVYTASRYGSIGAGWVWVSVNGLYLLTWLGYVHHKLESGLHWKWLRDDVLTIVFPVALISFIIKNFLIVTDSRFENILYVLLLGLIALFTAGAMSSFFRKRIFDGIR
jgi:O-antigen/teichoic acid export membrane protein